MHFVDVGTSGGIWGLEVGYCLMVGGDDEPVTRLEPIFNVARPGPTTAIGWVHVAGPAPVTT